MVEFAAKPASSNQMKTVTPARKTTVVAAIDA